MRTFIAIDLPGDARDALARQQAALRPVIPPRQERIIRWSRPGSIHLTLKYLGEIHADKLAQVKTALAAIAPVGKFTLTIKGFGFFPDEQRPEVLWAGIEAQGPLANLVKSVETAMSRLGFPQEKRPFTPHLTLARIKIPIPQVLLKPQLEKAGQSAIASFEVTEFVLFESRLLPSGAEYHKLARFPIQ
jgi:RNA 2',3'-cyclic 3'-phosphodiesterase